MSTELFDQTESENMSTELATVPTNDGQQLMSIIDRAMSSADFDVSKLQGVLDLKREWDRDRAAEAFAAAVTKFQSLCPQIHKGRKVQQMGFAFASFDDVMHVAQPYLAQCGIAVSFSTESNEKGIRVTVTLRVGTHTQDSTLDVPIPSALKVNDTQKYGAALTYAKRYALCAALNIVVTDEDSDAHGLDVETITDEQAVQIEEWIDSKNVNRDKFLNWAGVERLADLPAAKYQQAIDFLRRK